MNRAVFLDRDGVINRKAPEGDYITRWEDFRILDDVVEGVAQLNRAGFRVIVVTNQRCIAKGLMACAELEQIHHRMLEYLGTAGARIDAVYYCPHDTEPPCRCRKPAPGMLLDAAQFLDIDLTKSWMIGDSEIDVAAGRNAGCKTAWLMPENEVTAKPTHDGTAASNPDIVAASLLDAIRHILQSNENVAQSLAGVHSPETFSAPRSESH